MSPEDLKAIQDMINETLLPKVEEIIDEKVTNAVWGVAQTAQGILNQETEEGDDSEGGKGLSAGQVLKVIAALTPISQTVAQNVVPALLKRTEPTPVPMDQIRPIMDIFSNGMAFGVNAVSIATRAGHPIPDGPTFSNLIMGGNKVESNGKVSAAVTNESIEAEFKRLAE